MPRKRWLKSLTVESDTHLYVDVSGGVVPEEWKVRVVEEVHALKTIASELGRTTTLHLTAFSGELADDAAPIHVTASYPSDDELAALIEAMPMVLPEMVNFELVFNRINTSTERSSRGNVIISNLEWLMHPSQRERLYFELPMHLDYITVASTREEAKEELATVISGTRLAGDWVIS